MQISQRHVFVEKFYPFLRIFVDIYFIIVNFVFDALHYFNPKAVVDCKNLDDLLKLSATKTAALIRTNELDSLSVVQAYIKQLQKVNPYLNAIVQDNFDEALKAAQEVDTYIKSLVKTSDDASYAQLEKTKPLLGVPFTLKDNMKAKGMVMIAGDPGRIGSEPSEEDADCVKRIRDAGAILLCTSNLPPYACGCEANNCVQGRTNNPYDLRRTCGGSSGGEGALIGSGLVSLDGQIFNLDGPNMRKLWAIGPMCRFAEDLRLVLRTMVGDRIANERLHLNTSVDLTNMRLFYIEDLEVIESERVQLEMKNCVLKAVKHFEQTFELEAHKIAHPLAKYSFELWDAIFEADEPTMSLKGLFSELIKFIIGKSNMSLIGLEFSLHSYLSIGPSDGEYFRAKCDQLRSELISLLGSNGFLICPSMAETAPYHSQSYLKLFNNAECALFSALGFPAVVCPMEMNKNGLPKSVQIAGPPNSEGLLISVAEELERTFGGWVAPGF
ncbi:amidase domain-containing protein [Ditylenchus destructor]|uniref:Amidase domain-containing protein n=1 Tax=Ditylenchus destructor TaxID=166010 RepID=A0AAD4R1A1_9BILA|nr:amidase domain-containing protein [Ditylenchus destructor]